MARYPLEPLLRVRTFREKAAEQGVRTSEAVLAEAEKEKKRRQRALAEYHEWRTLEEDRRYASIMGQNLSLEELENFKAGFAALALTELEHEEAALAAEEQRQKAVTSVHEARAKFAAARKDTAKIAAHRDIWQEEQQKEAEKTAETELEDFRVPTSVIVA
ncbi:MAG: YscO family type III secretion system apparatus protein [Bilophila sp.]